MRRSIVATVIAVLPLGAGSQVQAIDTELADGVAERVWFHYDDPEIARTSYAAVDRTPDYGCSGIMIGPRTLLTAAHCGFSDDARFRLYTSEDEQIVERFETKQYIHTFRDTDLVLHYVYPKDGESAGTKYGYIDFDLVYDRDGKVDYERSRGKLTPGSAVYSHWQNRVDSLGGRHMLHSEGRIKRNDQRRATYAPNEVDDFDPFWRCHNDRPAMPLGVESDVWGTGGASGSGTLSQESHRLLLGPLSIASGPSRGQLSIVDYLTWGFADPDHLEPGCNPDYLPLVDVPFLTDLGVADPDQFWGYLDKNRDGVFDAQHGIEAALGEPARDWYWLGFDSQRRNALWTPEQAEVRFRTRFGVAEIRTDGARGGWVPVLSHDRLNLDPTKVYKVSFWALMTRQPSDEAPLRVVLEGAAGEQVKTFDPRRDGFVQTAIFAPQPGVERLRFEVLDGSRLDLLNVSVIALGAVMDFDTHDKRAGWKNGERPGLVWPNGIGSATEADWAGVVSASPDAEPDADTFTLANAHLGIAAGQDVWLCFQHRRADADPLSPDTAGVVRLATFDGLRRRAATASFEPGEAWQRTCTPRLRTASGHNVASFGIRAAGPARGAYLVDQVVVRTGARIDPPEVPLFPTDDARHPLPGEG